MRRRGGISRPFVLSAGLLAAALLAPSARAATIDVTATTDTGGSGCELREAIANANSDNPSPTNGCTRGSGADTINLPDGVIALDTEFPSSEPVISSDITLNGQGIASSRITLQNLTVGRILHVATNGNLALRSANLYGGVLADNGGAIKNEGVLSLDGVEMGENQAISSDGGAIYGAPGSSTTIANSVIGAPGHGNIADRNGGGISVAGGSLLVVNSLFADDQAKGANPNGIGGAISITDTSSTLHTHQIVHSVITNGQGDRGGGIFSSMVSPQSMRIDGSTFAGNAVTTSGGGGILFGPFTIVNSTFSGNSASNGGGLALDSSPDSASITSSTLAANQDVSPSFAAGIQMNGGQLTLESSILDDQGAGTDCTVSGGTIASGGYNLVSDTSCGLSGAGDLQSADPRLGPLADNGGPAIGAPGTP